MFIFIGESAMFINFIEIGHNHLLKHPLCESFLHLKWLKVRKFFFISLMFHLLFTILQTAFVLQVYAGPQCVMKNHCLSNDTDVNNRSVQLPMWKSESGDCFTTPQLEEMCQIEWSTIMVWVFLLMTTFVLGAKEIFQMIHAQKVCIKTLKKQTKPKRTYKKEEKKNI